MIRAVSVPFILLFLAVFALPLNTAGSTARKNSPAISGYVVDAETRETLVGASVRVKGSTFGTSTNKSGYFVISGLTPGKYTLIVTFIGYRKQEVAVDVSAGGSRPVTIALVPEAVKSDEIVVEGTKVDSDRDIPISRITIPTEQISKIRIGGEADVFRSIQYLPGVLSSSQISSGLYVRGGSPDQTLVLLDGTTVYNPSHLFGFFSTFNTDAIKDVELIKGGYPAEYGGRLSAVLDLVQKDGNRNTIEGVASLGLISSKLSLQGPVGNGSWFIGGRRTYIDVITGLLETADAPLPHYYFYDANAKIAQDLGPSDRLWLSGFAAKDEMQVEEAALAATLGIENQTAAARWTHVFSDNLFSVFHASWSRYANGFRTSNSGFVTEMGNGIRDLTLKGDAEWFASPLLTVKAGFEASRYTFTYVQNFTGSADSSIAEGSRDVGRMNLEASDYTWSEFVQANWRLTDEFSVQAGLRMNTYKLRNVTAADPRFAVRWQLRPDLAVKASWGVYHQYFRLASVPDFSFFDTWLPTDSTVDPSRAIHYVLGVEQTLGQGFGFTIDAYYKSLSNISEFITYTTTGRDVRDFFFQGRGEAYGVELFLQRKTGRLSGWIGYAVGFINEQFDRINEGRWFRPRWDRRHDLKIVTQYQLDDTWDLGATFTFQSGQSYTGMTSRVQTDMPGDNVAATIAVPAERYGLRLPPSHQLNVNATYHTVLFGRPFSVLLDVYNVYSRRDIWFRYYDTKGSITTVRDVRLLPILPSIALEMTF